MASGDSGASLNLPVFVVSVGTSNAASSGRDVWATVGGVTITACSVVFPLGVGVSEKSHVLNGTVNGDTARTINNTAHSFESMALRQSRAFDIATSIYVFMC